MMQDSINSGTPLQPVTGDCNSLIRILVTIGYLPSGSHRG
jgi:hypothetical protein